MSQVSEFRVDPATKSLVKVVESQTTEEELRAELQAAADVAQNRLNAANEAKTQSELNLTAAEEADEAADKEVEAASEEVQFSTARLGELDEASKLLAELVGTDPSETAAEDPTGAVSVPVTAVPSAEA